jgi:WD40 repeat protein
MVTTQVLIVVMFLELTVFNGGPEWQPSTQSAAERVDQVGDPLPEGALLRLGTAHSRHHDVIHTLALTPDGKTVATAGSKEEYPEEPIRLWDVATGREVRKLDHGDPEGLGSNWRCQVAFTRDRRNFAVAGHGGLVRIWSEIRRGTPSMGDIPTLPGCLF